MTTASTGQRQPDRLPFAVRLARARAAGRPLLDLAGTDPARCGLTATLAEGEAPPAAGALPAEALRSARDAVASWLAGRRAPIAPERVVFAASHDVALRYALRAVCGAGDEVAIALPADPALAAAPTAASLVARPFLMEYEGAWRIDRRALAASVSGRARAVLIGNPSEPTGMALSGDDVALLDEVCATHRLALVADEALAETVAPPSPSVLEAVRSLSVHVGDIAGVCDGGRAGAAWCAVGGPEHLAGPALERLRRLPAADAASLASVASLLARRGEFQARVRSRIALNRALLASESLREAPWSLLWGRGGRWAVLEVSSADPDEDLSAALLEDDVVVQPSSTFGLPRSGYLVVSLLSSPEVFHEALRRVEQRLRGPLLRG